MSDLHVGSQEEYVKRGIHILIKYKNIYRNMVEIV